MAIMTSTPMMGNLNDTHYHNFLQAVQARFAGETDPLFTTTAGEALYAAYLGSFSTPEERQYHTCSACREFFRLYGGLVTIGEDGATESVFFAPELVAGAPLDLCPALDAMARLVRKAKVTGLFLTKAQELGKPVTGAWRHFGVSVPPHRRWTHRAILPHQQAAEKATEFQTIVRALVEYPLPVLELAVQICEGDHLYRIEKVLGQAQWLRDLGKAWASGVRKTEKVWRAVALAPSGFCHPRSSMISTLLDDLQAGLPFETVKARFGEKMHPLRYQRPQALPAEGAIAQAERLVAQLGLAPALKRRFLGLEETPLTVWTPPPVGEPVPTPGVFGHLLAKGQSPQTKDYGVDGGRVTYQRFLATVLPKAERVEVYLTGGPQSFCVLTTAVDPEAPPILQWDREDQRNPVAWYVWHGGSPAAQYGLTMGFHPVVGVTGKPCHWHPEVPHAHHHEGVLFLLTGARETRGAGLALFPETLKGDLHGIRAVVEAFSRKGQLEDIPGNHAVGLLLDKGGKSDLRVRVKAGALVATYTVDRWE